MLQKILNIAFPSLRRDSKQYPALLAFLFTGSGIYLYRLLPVALPIWITLPLLSIPFVLLIHSQWKYLLFIPIGFLTIASQEAKRIQIPSYNREFHLEFHTPPLFECKEGFRQKVSIPESPCPIITTLKEPLTPGESRVVRGNYDERENHLTIDSCLSSQKKRRGKIYTLLKKRISHINSPIKSYYYALILRERYLVDQSIVEIFEYSGLIHLMAISGLHIAILGLIIYRLLYLLPLPRHWHFALSAIITSTVLFIIGPSPSTNRALIMFLSFALAPLFQRGRNTWNSLGIAGLIILLLSPLDLFTAGFQLSFTATTAVLLALTIARKARYKISKWLLFSCSSTILIFLFSSPILLWHFDEIVPASLLYNVIALPLLSLTFTLSLLSLCLSLLIPSVGLACMNGIAEADLFLLNMIQESIIQLQLTPLRQFFSYYQIAGLATLIYTIVLFYKKRVAPTILYPLMVLATLLIAYPFNGAKESSSKFLNVREDSFLLLDLTKRIYSKDIIDDLKNYNLQQLQLLHIVCFTKDEAFIRKKIAAYLPTKKVYYTVISETVTEQGPECISVGDSLMTPWGIYTLSSSSSNDLNCILKESVHKDCFSYKIELPLNSKE